jgi:hypothetical protein
MMFLYIRTSRELQLVISMRETVVSNLDDRPRNSVGLQLILCRCFPVGVRPSAASIFLFSLPAFRSSAKGGSFGANTVNRASTEME